MFLSVMTRMAGSGSINLQQLALGIEVVVLLLLKQDQQTVSITLKSDGQLNASNNDVNLFDTVTLPAAVNDHLKMRRRFFSRRALMTMSEQLLALKRITKRGKTEDTPAEKKQVRLLTIAR